MRYFLMLSLVLSAGCKKKVAEPTGPEMPRSVDHPDLKCMEGTIGAGSPPPAGLEVYCAKVLPDMKLLKHGMAIEWHTQTRRKARGQYLEGVKIGEWIVWHPTGSPMEQGNYVAGKRDGTWEMFHSDGSPASKGDYVGGKENGDWTYWAEDGSTRTEAHWRDGQRDGTWLVYDVANDSEPRSERVYSNGRMVSQRELRLGE